MSQAELSNLSRLTEKTLQLYLKAVLSKAIFFKKISFFLIVLIFLGSTSFLFFKNLSNSKQVLSEKVEVSPDVSPQVSDNPSPSPTPTPELSPSPTTKKKEFTIALFGDSMIDTAGENLEYLEKSLNIRYPGVKFNLFNYGIGGQNVEEGLSRFNKDFKNRERNFPAISTLGADIIIIGSFAYNPFPPHNREKHLLILTNLVNEAKKTGADIYLLAEIAPIKVGFGKGPGGINWPEDMAAKHTANIIEQLENAVSIAKSQGVPLINAYFESQVDGKWGNPNYVSSNDGIHPSVLGHTFTADLIATTLEL